METPRYFDEVPHLLRSAVDFIALDGHGWTDDKAAYFGINDDLRVCPSTLRGDRGEGIVAPIIVFGFCCGATDPFRNAIEGAIDRSEVALSAAPRRPSTTMLNASTRRYSRCWRGSVATQSPATPTRTSN